MLNEFLKFRHFHRSYAEFDYDWDKIEYLQRKFESLTSLIIKEVTDYQAFLRKLF